MKVDRLCLKNYRNIDLVDIEFSPYVNILYGDNAQGKTNILESLLCVLLVEVREQEMTKN